MFHNLTKVTKILTKKTFRKIFRSVLKFLELQKKLVDDLVDFSELPMFMNASLP